jgi:hypothetical protein
MRGVTISMFVLCVAIFAGFMATGVNQELGLGLTTDLDDEANETSEQLGGEQGLSERGGSGLLGFSVYAVEQLTVLFTLIGSIASILTAWGVPVQLAAGIELIARVIQALAIVWMARGVIGE